MENDVSSQPSSDLASALNRKYSVFLSFYGPETRQGFVHHLVASLRRAGIQSFLDEDIMRGAEISAQMSSALRDSESSVVIFSEGYASSRWCLDELVKIIECQETLGQLVFSIFYRLNPNDVRYQSGRFGEAFSKLSERFVDHPGKVQRWKDALVHVGSLKGWVQSGESSNALLIREIVKILRERLRGSYCPRPLLVAPIDASPPSFPSTAVRTVQYDVFISFRGTDTRNNFTSHLYAALARHNLGAFSDEMAKVNMNAIEESRSSVIVFSKDYASSEWCLDELVKILDCRKTLGQLVVPVFYHVDPSDVRRQLGAFCAVFGQQAESSDDLYRVRQWGDALVEVSSLAGWATSNMKSESFLVQEIVSNLSEKLRQTCLVGIDLRISKLMNLLRLGSPNVGTVGIYGIGGVGKTTLAKAVYHRIHSTFDASCFVEKLTEDSGFSALLRKLVSQISEDQSSSDYTINLRHAKVLIVLDDIDYARQCASLIGKMFSFDPGSRIIVTTKSKDVLADLEDNCTYEVEGLNIPESLELFSRTAFGKVTPEKDYLELSKSIVKYASGVPLALKLLGSCLYGSSKRTWQIIMPQLKSLPDQQIHEVFRASFDELDDEEKDIFLDIACFFKGMDVDFVKEILDGFGFSSEIGIAVLIEKGLLTISDNRLMMHDLVQVMGRGIVRQENCFDVGKRSRLWDHDDVRQVLTTETGTRTLRGICIYLDLSKPGEIDMCPAAFSKMHNLRYLQISNQSAAEVCKVYPPVGLDSFPKELVFLHWHGYPLHSLPSHFPPYNLIELDIPYSHLKRLWSGAMVLPNLKRIGLSYSRYLIEMPDLSLASKLEKLNLEGCTSLHEFPVSISCPSSLVILNMRGCDYLETISDVASVKALEIVDPSCGPELRKDPHFSWSLSELCLAGTRIRKLPTFIKNLHKLAILDLEACRRLESLPELPSSLEYLDAHDCVALKSVSVSSFVSRGMASSFVFSNCYKLRNPSDIFPLAAQPEFQRVTTASTQTYEDLQSSPMTICFPETVVSRWFDFSRLGSSINIEIPSTPSCNSLTTGFALCVVVSFDNYDDAGQFNIGCKCHFKTKSGCDSDLIAYSGGWVGGEESQNTLERLQSDALCRAPFELQNMINQYDMPNSNTLPIPSSGNDDRFSASLGRRLSSVIMRNAIHQRNEKLGACSVQERRRVCFHGF